MVGLRDGGDGERWLVLQTRPGRGELKSLSNGLAGFTVAARAESVKCSSDEAGCQRGCNVPVQVTGVRSALACTDWRCQIRIPITPVLPSPTRPKTRRSPKPALLPATGG